MSKVFNDKNALYRFIQKTMVDNGGNWNTIYREVFRYYNNCGFALEYTDYGTSKEDKVRALYYAAYSSVDCTPWPSTY